MDGHDRERERQDVKKARLEGQRPEREGGRVICMWLTTHGKGASLLFSRFFGELVKKLLVIHRIKQELKKRTVSWPNYAFRALYVEK